MNRIRIGSLEREIIVHRLEVPDAMFEALTIPCLAGKDHNVTSEEVEASAERLTKAVEGGSIVWDELSPIDKLVLRESVEGSTCTAWYDCPGDAEMGRLHRRVMRAYDRLLGKLPEDS